jgi:hypothetical protein
MDRRLRLATVREELHTRYYVIGSLIVLRDPRDTPPAPATIAHAA